MPVQAREAAHSDRCVVIMWCVCGARGMRQRTPTGRLLVCSWRPVGLAASTNTHTEHAHGDVVPRRPDCQRFRRSTDEACWLR